MSQLEKFSYASKFTTVIHNDLWLTNMMFVDADDGRPENVKLLDLACFSLNHPAVDLWWFLYMSTDRKFRSKHLDQLLSEYFGVFSSYLGSGQDGLKFEDFKRELDDIRGGPMAFITTVSR